MSKRKAPKGKKINPQYWVFCEGKTEEAYVKFLRTKYRIPIEIITKITGTKINERLITRAKQSKPKHPKDKDYLLYDADKSDVLEKLNQIKNAKLLLSNPTIELWFLLHYKHQSGYINNNDCIKEISKRNRNEYKKGLIDNKLKEKLEGQCRKACERAKQLKIPDNPSTNIYELIADLEHLKKNK